MTVVMLVPIERRVGGSVTMRRMSLEVEQAIAQLPLYRRLQADDRAKLAAVSTLQSFPRASQIFREGDPARSVHVVVDGRVKVAKLTPAGREVILDMPGPGDPIGAVEDAAGGGMAGDDLADGGGQVDSVQRELAFRSRNGSPAGCSSSR